MTATQPASVLFLTGQLGMGGAERQMSLLATGLRRRDVQVGVLSFNGGHGDYWEAELRRHDIALECIERDAGQATRVRRVLDAVSRWTPDIVHSWSVHTNFYAATAGVLCRPAKAIGSDRSSHYASRRQLGWLRYQLSVRGLHALVVNSLAAVTAAQELGAGCRAIAVPNAVEPMVRGRDRSAVRAELGVPAGSFAFVGVGALRRTKRWEVVLEAVHLARSRGANVSLVLFGDGPERDALNDQIGALDLDASVILAGPHPNARGLMSGFDGCCFASMDEGMPNVVMEASAAGLPVLAADAAGIPEVVVNGQTGILVDGSADAFADGMVSLSGDATRATAIGEQGRIRMETVFSPDRLVTRMLSVYASAIASKAVN
jgi:glycosyltransferase involved in cell wall biosynthesis